MILTLNLKSQLSIVILKTNMDNYDFKFKVKTIIINYDFKIKIIIKWNLILYLINIFNTSLDWIFLKKNQIILLETPCSMFLLLITKEIIIMIHGYDELNYCHFKKWKGRVSDIQSLFFLLTQPFSLFIPKFNNNIKMPLISLQFTNDA